MSDVFISYSRKDIAFARLIHRCFEESNLKTWIDWQDIPPAEDWLKEISTAIEQADTFVFIISSTSIASQVCKLELAHAQENHKRIIPVVVHDLGAKTVTDFSPILSTLNWIFFLDGREFRLLRISDAGQPQMDVPETAAETEAIPNEPQFQHAVHLLTKAIQTDQEYVRQHTRLQVRALEWERNKAESSYLLHGKDLEQAEQWLAGSGSKDPQPTSLHAQYILASRQVAIRRQRLTLSAVIAGLMVAIGLGIFAWISRGQAVSESHQRATAQAIAEDAQATAVAESQVRATAQAVAEEQRNTALSRQLAAQALNQLPYEYDLSLLLAAEATRIEDNLETRGALLTALTSHPFYNRALHGIPPVALYSGSSRRGDGVAFSPDGKYVAVGNQGKTVLLWNVATGQLVGDPLTGHAYVPSALVFTPDGTHLASGGCAEIEHISCTQGEVFLWDLSSHQPEWGPIQIDEMDGVTNLSISRDGKSLFAASLNDTVAIIDMKTGEVLNTISGVQPTDEPIIEHAMAIDPGGKWVATSLITGDLVLRDLFTGEEVARTMPVPSHWAYTLRFSPDGRILVAGIGSQVYFFSAPNLEPLGKPVDAGLPSVWTVSFSPNGKVVVSGWNDHTIRLINVEESEFIGPVLTGHNEIISSTVMSPDSQWMASVDWDDRVILWNLSGSQFLLQKPLTRTQDLHTQNWEMLFDPQDSTRMLSIGCSSGNPEWLCHIIPWDLTSLLPFAPETTLPYADAFEIGIRPDGHQFGIWDGSTRFTLFDLPTVTRTDPNIISRAASLFSPDGKTFVVEDNGLQIIDVEDLQSIHHLAIDEYGNANSLSFNLDGRYLVMGSYEGAVVWWDVHSGEPIVGKPSTGGTMTTDWIEAVAFSPDSKVIAAGDGRGQILLFETQTGKSLGDALILPATAFGDGSLASSGIQSLAFLPDGHTLTAGYRSGALVFWDMDNHQMIGPPVDTELLYGEYMNGLGPYRIQVSPDGQRLALGAGSLSIWELSLDEWRKAACHMANRSLTPQEWTKYLGDTPYHDICAGEGLDG